MNAPGRFAYFKICECGKHGTIVLNDKYETGPFVTKKHGLKVAQQLRDAEHLNLGEYAVICDHIEASQLLRDDILQEQCFQGIVDQTTRSIAMEAQEEFDDEDDGTELYRADSEPVSLSSEIDPDLAEELSAPRTPNPNTRH